MIMRKILLILLVFSVLFSIPVFSANDYAITFAVSDDGQNISYYVNVKGNYAEKEGIVGFKLQDSLGIPVYYGQTEADENGDYKLKIKLNNSGGYNAYANSSHTGVVLPKNFTIPDISDYDDLISILNNADTTVEEYTSCFSNGAYYGLDTEFFDSAVSGKDNIINELFSKKGRYTPGKLTELYLEGVIAGIAKSEESYTFKDTVIKNYMGDPIIPDSRYTNLYNTYVASTNTFKENVWNDMLSRNLTDYENIQASLYASVIKTALKSMNNQELDSFLLNNLDLPDYENLGPVKKTNIITKIKPLDFDTVEKFEENYRNAKSDVEDENLPPPPPPSTLGGGGGGGGGSTVKEYEKLPEPESEKEEKEEEKQQFIEAGFTDLSDVLWAKEAIEYFKRNGVVSGKTETEFAPLDKVTRAEFCKIIVNAFGIEADGESMKFTDVSENDWYYPYVLKAYHCGLLSGYEDGSFRADNKVTREQMVTILYRYLQRKQMVKPLDKIENKFSDYEDISDYARTSVLVLNNAGYVNGVGSGMFMPKNEAGRAEVCVFIYNILNGGVEK